MKCKKVLSSVLIMAVLFTLFSVFSLPASAISATSVTIPSVTGEVGKTVTVDIKMSGVFAAMKGKIEYDSSLLTFTKITQNTKELDGYAFITETSPENIISFAYANANNVTLNNATLLTLEFTCKAIGTASVTMSDMGIYQAKESGEGSDEATELCTLTNGAVTVAEAEKEKYATKITLNSSALSVTKGLTEKLTYTLTPSDAQDTVTYSSSNTKVAKVNAKTGVVTGVNPGTATITATGKNKSVTCKVTVYSYVSLRVGKVRAISNGVKTTVDDQGTKPFKISGKTMLPLRFVGEKMGGKVKYEGDSKPIILTYGDKKVEFRLNSKKMTVYTGTKQSVVTLDVAAQKKSGKTYIPVRAISQALGFTVYYQNGTELIVVNTPKMDPALRNIRLAEAKPYITK